MCSFDEWVVLEVSKDCGAYEVSWATQPVTASYLKRSSSLTKLLWGPQTSQLCTSVVGHLNTQQRWEFFGLWTFTVICWQSDIGIVLFWTRNITSILKIKVKCSHCRPSVAQRVGRGIALLLHDRDTRRGEWSAARPGCTLPLGKTIFTEGWVGPRACLDGWNNYQYTSQWKCTKQVFII